MSRFPHGFLQSKPGKKVFLVNQPYILVKPDAKHTWAHDMVIKSWTCFQPDSFRIPLDKKPTSCTIDNNWSWDWGIISNHIYVSFSDMPRCGGTPQKQPVGRSRGYSLVSGASSLFGSIGKSSQPSPGLWHIRGIIICQQYIWNIPLYPLYMFGYIYHVYSINIMLI